VDATSTSALAGLQFRTSGLTGHLVIKHQDEPRIAAIIDFHRKKEEMQKP
jgi:hypothetical protein